MGRSIRHELNGVACFRRSSTAEKVRFGSYGLSRNTRAEYRENRNGSDLPDRPKRLSETKSSHSEIIHCLFACI